MRPASGEMVCVDDPSVNRALPWTEKYRPVGLSEVVAHKAIVDVINKFADGGQLPHLLFHGPPGTGKTSTILALAKELYGLNFSNMVLELNASDARGINVVRDEIQSFASTMRPFSTTFKLVIMDECDSMTKDAQFALRRIMEKYTQHTRFCLICNYASKVIPALQSRCTKFRFSPIASGDMLQRLRHIVNSENFSISDNSLATIQKLGEGDMRKTVNILQSVSLSASVVTDDAIHLITGHVGQLQVDELLRFLLNEPLQGTFEHFNRLKCTQNFALVDIVKPLSESLLTLHMAAGTRARLLRGLSDIEYSLSFACSEKNQTLHLISLFHQARFEMTRHS